MKHVWTGHSRLQNSDRCVKEVGPVLTGVALMQSVGDGAEQASVSNLDVECQSDGGKRTWLV